MRVSSSTKSKRPRMAAQWPPVVMARMTMAASARMTTVAVVGGAGGRRATPPSSDNKRIKMIAEAKSVGSSSIKKSLFSCPQGLGMGSDTQQLVSNLASMVDTLNWGMARKFNKTYYLSLKPKISLQRK
jgi:hypothetical protein